MSARRTGERHCRALPAAAAFCCAMLAAYLCLLLFCRFDNRYTRPGPDAERGVLTLTEEDERAFPLLFLDRDWAFYSGRLLSPGDFQRGAPEPTCYLYPGQYGGFELGRAMGEPRGCSTYRMRIVTEGPARDRTLELPEIYSSYRLWINGALRQTMGEPDPASYRAETRCTSVTFSTAGEIEIVLAVSNFTNYYSGLVTPPAFGQPDAVQRMTALRLCLHAFFCALAAVVGLFCLLLGGRNKSMTAPAAFALLCACFAGYTGYPILHLFSTAGRGWYTAENCCFYGMILALCVIAGALSALPAAARAVSIGAGAGACILVAVFPLLPCAWDVGAMRCYSGILRAYKWTGALYLIAAGVYAVARRRHSAWTLLAGFGVFGCALAADGSVPLFDPVYTGQPAELGGLAVLILVSAALIADTMRRLRETIAARAQADAARGELQIQREHAGMLEQYIRQTGVIRHEAQKNLSLLRFYHTRGDLDGIGRLLDTLCESAAGPTLPAYTQHTLVNAILASKLTRAQENDVKAACNVTIPKTLPLEDADLCSLLGNLLDNAVEACLRLPETAERRIEVQLRMSGDYLLLVVENSAPPRAGRTSKDDALSHGYGLRIIEGIVEKYSGIQRVERGGGTYCVHIALLTAQDTAVSGG